MMITKITKLTFISALLASILATGANAGIAKPSAAHCVCVTAPCPCDEIKDGFKIAGPWRGHQGKFRNTNNTRPIQPMPNIWQQAKIYDVYPDGTVVFR